MKRIQRLLLACSFLFAALPLLPASLHRRRLMHQVDALQRKNKELQAQVSLHSPTPAQVKAAPNTDTSESEEAVETVKKLQLPDRSTLTKDEQTLYDRIVRYKDKLLDTATFAEAAHALADVVDGGILSRDKRDDISRSHALQVTVAVTYLVPDSFIEQVALLAKNDRKKALLEGHNLYDELLENREKLGMIDARFASFWGSVAKLKDAFRSAQPLSKRAQSLLTWLIDHKEQPLVTLVKPLFKKVHNKRNRKLIGSVPEIRKLFFTIIFPPSTDPNHPHGVDFPEDVSKTVRLYAVKLYSSVIDNPHDYGWAELPDADEYRAKLQALRADAQVDDARAVPAGMSKEAAEVYTVVQEAATVVYTSPTLEVIEVNPNAFHDVRLLTQTLDSVYDTVGGFLTKTKVIAQNSTLKTFFIRFVSLPDEFIDASKQLPDTKEKKALLKKVKALLQAVIGSRKKLDLSEEVVEHAKAALARLVTNHKEVEAAMEQLEQAGQDLHKPQLFARAAQVLLSLIKKEVLFQHNEQLRQALLHVVAIQFITHSGSLDMVEGLDPEAQKRGAQLYKKILSNAKDLGWKDGITLDGTDYSYTQLRNFLKQALKDLAVNDPLPGQLSADDQKIAEKIAAAGRALQTPATAEKGYKQLHNIIDGGMGGMRAGDRDNIAAQEELQEAVVTAISVPSGYFMQVRDELEPSDATRVYKAALACLQELIKQRNRLGMGGARYDEAFEAATQYQDVIKEIQQQHAEEKKDRARSKEDAKIEAKMHDAFEKLRNLRTCAKGFAQLIDIINGGMGGMSTGDRDNIAASPHLQKTLLEIARFRASNNPTGARNHLGRKAYVRFCNKGYLFFWELCKQRYKLGMAGTAFERDFQLFARMKQLFFKARKQARKRKKKNKWARRRGIEAVTDRTDFVALEKRMIREEDDRKKEGYQVQLRNHVVSLLRNTDRSSPRYQSLVQKRNWLQASLNEYKKLRKRNKKKRGSYQQRKQRRRSSYQRRKKGNRRRRRRA